MRISGSGWRGLLGLAVGLLWFGWGAPEAVRRLDAARVETTRRASLEDLRKQAGSSRDPRVRSLLAAAGRASARENDWGRTVAGLLTPAERQEGLTRAATLPPIVGGGLHNLLEPEVAVLVRALQDRYGPRTAPVPALAPVDAWATVDRRARARAILALVQGPGVDPDRAAMLLGATLDLLEAQRERGEIEDLLRLALGG